MAIIHSSTTLEYKYQIQNISKLTQQLTPKIMVQGVQWYVQFQKESINGEKWLSCYLWCENKDESHDWSRTAFITVSLLPFYNNVEPITATTLPYVFNISRLGYGRSKFVKWDQLTNIQNRLVRDDIIWLKIKIKIADPNDEKQSIVKFDMLDKCCGHGYYTSFRMTISNIDALMSVATPQFDLRNLPWKMSVFNCESKWLGYRIETHEETNNGEVICKATVKLISTKDDAKSIEHVLSKKMSRRGVLLNAKCVTWNNLFDDQNGFVHDNSIQLLVKISADQPDDDACSANKRQMAYDQSECAKTSKMECSICMKDIRDQEVSSLPCTHLFCTKCIKDAITIRKRCPICNVPAKLTDLRRVRLPFVN